jgi:hypothetical protein
MPTIGHVAGLDVMIFRNDHDPPHFHVIGDDFSAKFAILDGTLTFHEGSRAAPGDPPCRGMGTKA